MKECSVCGGTDLAVYPYGNHHGGINAIYAKHFLARAVCPLLKVLQPRLYRFLRLKMMFSPFSNIVRCNRCGYGAYDGSLNEESLEDYYRTVYWGAEAASPDACLPEKPYLEDGRANGQHLFVKKWLAPYKELNVLEIGAGRAFFSRLLRERHAGPVRLHAVEAGDCWAEYYKTAGISLVSGFFPFESARKYDYIHTSHWLEHVLDPARAAERIRGLLNAEGLLFVEVPNCDPGYFAIDRGDAPHIHFFTKDSLRAFFEKCGFDALAAGEYGLTNQEELVRAAAPESFEPAVLEEGAVSIRENKERQGGYVLRGLFRLR